MNATEQWCVFSGDNPDDGQVLISEELADVEEMAQLVVDAGIARRTLTAGGWIVQPRCTGCGSVLDGNLCCETQRAAVHALNGIDGREPTDEEWRRVIAPDEPQPDLATFDLAWRAVARCLGPRAEVHPTRSREFAQYVAEEVLRAIPAPAAAEEPSSVTRVRAELVKALNFWRWCWECGARDADCKDLGYGRKCCPDCRHRDAGNVVLAKVIAAPCPSDGIA